LQHKITELTSRLTGNQQAVQAEILVLEEENIELLKENKELRNQVLDYQMRAERGASVSSVSSSLEVKQSERKFGNQLDGNVIEAQAVTRKGVASAKRGTRVKAKPNGSPSASTSPECAQS
jgi:hypothetical protein